MLVGKTSHLCRRVHTAAETLRAHEIMYGGQSGVDVDGNWVAGSRREAVRVTSLRRELERATLQLDQADAILNGAALHARNARLERFSREFGTMPVSEDQENHPPGKWPEVVLSNSDYVVAESHVAQGQHGFLFSFQRELAEVMLTAAKFRLMVQPDSSSTRMYCGVYRAREWQDGAMTGPEFLRLPEHIRNGIVARVSQSPAGSAPFNAVDEEFARSRRVLACIVLQCVRPHTNLWVPPRIRAAQVPAAFSALPVGAPKVADAYRQVAPLARQPLQVANHAHAAVVPVAIAPSVWPEPGAGFAAGVPRDSNINVFWAPAPGGRVAPVCEPGTPGGEDGAATGGGRAGAPRC
ncbi:hypothetical protein BV25DRAFT_690405 [Artomyces pyxidatus]|uniref:Uncharacterized protein n=1 Tax=Artomyces pyxidatus TaxID=48021 RepID=A0ACB8T0Q3_9AGAM|nr:hypothetical protein BV25DRAFT_690405 [Artomyces pyxidatus]